MVKVVVNKCYGGFGLSHKAFEWLINERGWKVTSDDNTNEIEYPIYEFQDKRLAEMGKYYLNWRDDEMRAHADLVACVETLGADANGQFAQLEIIDVPDDVKWYIDDYDGMERIREVHRVW